MNPANIDPAHQYVFSCLPFSCFAQDVPHEGAIAPNVHPAVVFCDVALPAAQPASALLLEHPLALLEPFTARRRLPCSLSLNLGSSTEPSVLLALLLPVPVNCDTVTTSNGFH